MKELTIKGAANEQEGRRKQIEASQTGDRHKYIEGKEEELVGKLQKKFAKGEDEVLKTMDEMEEEGDIR